VIFALFAIVAAASSYFLDGHQSPAKWEDGKIEERRGRDRKTREERGGLGRVARLLPQTKVRRMQK
jgi:hypothetical protein